MSSTLYTWQLTIPHGTLSTAPAVRSLLVPPSFLGTLRVRIPPGPRGAVGWQVWYGGSQAFPYAAGSWIVADDATVEIAPSAELSSGAWSLRAYNTGDYPHTLYIEAEVSSTARRAANVAPKEPLALP